jgi:hypothetical protein
MREVWRVLRADGTLFLNLVIRTSLVAAASRARSNSGT